MATNATYKSYDGSNWVEFHFTTNAAQVGVTASRKFVTTSTKVNNVAFTLDASGNGASVTIKGSDIASNVTAQSGKTLQYIANADTIAAALSKLDAAAKAAYDHTPSGVLTSSNYTSTLDSAYLGKTAKAADADKLDNHDSTYFATATALSNHTGATGNPHSVTKSQVGLGSVVNKGMDNTPTSGSENYVKSGGVYTAIQNVLEVANGKTSVFVISANETIASVKAYLNDAASHGAGSYYRFFVWNNTTKTYDDKTDALLTTTQYDSIVISNSVFKTQNDSITEVDRTKLLYRAVPKNSAPGASGTQYWYSIYYGTGQTFAWGDVLYLTETNYPDRWYSAMDGWSRLETAKVDLSWNAITGKPTFATVATSGKFADLLEKPTTLSGYGITDAYIDDNGKITIGGVSTTPLYEHQSLSGYISKTGNYGKGNLITGNKYFKDGFAANVIGIMDNNGNIQYDNIYFSSEDSAMGIHSSLGLILHTGQATGVVRLNAGNASTLRTVSFPDSDGTLALLSTSNKVTILGGTTAPSNPRAGDVWINVSN